MDSLLCVYDNEKWVGIEKEWLGGGRSRRGISKRTKNFKIALITMSSSTTLGRAPSTTNNANAHYSVSKCDFSNVTGSEEGSRVVSSAFASNSRELVNIMFAK